jgi:hypothetical protein
MMVAIAEAIGITAVSLLIWWAVWWVPKQFDKAPVPKPDRWKIILDISYQDNHKQDLERYMCLWSLQDHEPDNNDLFYLTLTSGVEFDYNIAQVQARAITTAKVAALEQTRKEAEAIHKEVTFP